MPMDSNTLAAWVSKCSMVSSSISMLERIASGSPPSTSDCSPFFKNSSCSCSTAGSSPSRPCLRAMLLHSTIFSIIAVGSAAGGLNTQEMIFQARRNVDIGVCTRLAARVPTTTITNAALPTSAPALEPFKIAPPMIAIRPSTTPMMLRMSMRLRGTQPFREPGAQAHERLPVDLADARFGHLEHLADFSQIHVLVVIKGQHELLALGQAVDRRGERIPEGRLLDVIEGSGALVAGVVRRARFVLARAHLIEAEQPAARRV